MPRPKGSFKTVPSYRLHKPSGRAVVTIAGQDCYLGAHGSCESREAYDRLVAEWLASGRASAASRPADARSSSGGISIVEVVAAFWRHAQLYYRRPDGTPTKEAKNFRDALRPLKRLYGDLPAAQFGPVALRAVREEMVRRGWCRNPAMCSDADPTHRDTLWRRRAPCRGIRGRATDRGSPGSPIRSPDPVRRCGQDRRSASPSPPCS